MKRREHDLTAALFFRLLPVQAAIAAMGSINAIVDGIVAARFIDAATVGVVGLYYPMMRVLEAVTAVLLGGMSVLSGRYLGSGRIDRARGICSLAQASALLIGVVLTVFSLFAPDILAGWLGASDGLRDALIAYITGYAIGIVPQLLVQQLAAGLQLEHQEKLANTGIVVMIVTNVVLDLVFVVVLKKGVWGLALSTSMANWAYFWVLALYYFTGRAQLEPSVKLIAWRELPDMLRIGSPGALLVICLAARSIVINRLLLIHSGEDGLSAMSSFNMVSGLILALSLGNGAVVRMLTSVFIGEENREGLRSLMKLVLTRVLAMTLGVSVALILLSPWLSDVFFPDRTANAYQLTQQLFLIYSTCVPMSMLLITYSNYCQAVGHQLYVNTISVIDGFFSMVIPSLLLAPRLGALGVWLSLPIGMMLSICATVIYVAWRGKRWPRSLDDWLLLPSSFGKAERLVFELRSLGDVAQTAERVQSFCEKHGFSNRISASAGLCLEEMAGNIIRHGFDADRGRHVIELHVIIRERQIVLRIKDDCIPFDPREWYEITAAEVPTTNIGIRLVFRIAEEVEYQHLLGLNVLTLSLSDKKRSS